MSKERLQHPFDAIVDDNSRVLILGSFPSIKSFEQNFYYAHPRNQFWPIMEALFGVTLRTNEEKKAFALEKGIALWDTYASLKREAGNSSDANLKELQPNDFRAFLKAYQGYMKQFKEIDIDTTLLPSTSPAHAAMKKEEKLERYRAIKDALE